jgi:hypothetical protein
MTDSQLHKDKVGAFVSNSQEPMNDSTNQRGAGLGIRVEERKHNEYQDQGEWMEVRVQGKLPERRSNHSSFVATVGNQE